jgi:hypothetical protein
VQDAGRLGVGVPDLDDDEIFALSVNQLSGAVTAVTGEGGMPGYTLSQTNGRAATLACIWLIVPAVATTRAPNRSANNPATRRASAGNSP